MRVSTRARQVKMSTTIAIDEKARQMKAEGLKLWSFGAGQPDFPTPVHVAEAGIRAIREGKTTYTSPNGTPELRRAICEKLSRDNGLEYEPDQIVVSAGAKQALFMALSVVVEPGDEVLIPAPYWVSYPEMVVLLGGVPVIIPTDASSGFKITPESLRSAITPRSSAIILNTPGNPSGMLYTREELEGLGRVLVDSQVRLITDEIYERIIFDGVRHVSPVEALPGMKERSCVVNGVSKAFSMTGWRIGYMAAPRDWAAPASAMQSHLSGNPCSISQEATLEALRGSGETVDAMVAAFSRRRERVLEILKQARDLRVVRPQGAFYVFPDFSSYYGRSCNGRRVEGSQGMAEYLLEDAHTALVPGHAFGSDDNLRISYACSDATIEEGLHSLVQALERMR